MAVKKPVKSEVPAYQLGDKVKPFRIENSRGESFDLAKQKGRTTVLFFYPKDDTSGCTCESKDFSLLKKNFAKVGADIFGISRDSVLSHQKFIAKYDLQIELLSDPDEVVCRAFGVIREKSMYGRKFLGVERSTFVLDEDLRIIEEIRKVKVTDHARGILDVLQKR